MSTNHTDTHLVAFMRLFTILEAKGFVLNLERPGAKPIVAGHEVAEALARGHLLQEGDVDAFAVALRRLSRHKTVEDTGRFEPQRSAAA